jgi:hypothetical protein
MYGIGFGYGAIGATTKRSGGVAIDTDAQAFFTASGITDLTQKSAVNQLVLDLKSNSLWTKMKALYPIVGGNATAHSYNLINTSLYQLSFSSGWTHSITGMLPNGVNAYADTGLVPNSVLSLTSSHFSLYSRSSHVGGNYACSGVGNGTSWYNLYLRYYNDKRMAVMYSDNALYYADGGTQTDAKGYYIGTRIASNNIKLYKNGSVVGSSTNTETGSSMPIYSVYLSAHNSLGTPNGVTYDNKELSFCTIGLGLNSTESIALSTIVNTFNTTLGRNTY